MEIIKCISKKIGEEIKDATSYAEMALEYRDEYPDLANVLHRISLEETNHMNMLHNEVTKIIQKYKSENGEPPKAMLDAYNIIHGMFIEDAADAKSLQTMFQEKVSP